MIIQDNQENHGANNPATSQLPRGSERPVQEVLARSHQQRANLAVGEGVWSDDNRANTRRKVIEKRGEKRFSEAAGEDGPVKKVLVYGLEVNEEKGEGEGEFDEGWGDVNEDKGDGDGDFEERGGDVDVRTSRGGPIRAGSRMGPIRAA